MNNRTLRNIFVFYIFFSLGLSLYGFKYGNFVIFAFGFYPILYSLSFISLAILKTNYYLSNKSQHHLDLSENYHAIIFAPQAFYLDWVIKISGIDIVASWCAENCQNFFIHTCRTPLEFETVLKNPNSEFIWVFGHGRSIHEFCLKEGIYDYDNLSDFPQGLKKKFVAQLHCSPGSGHSLPSRISQDYSHSIVSNDNRWFYQNRKEIQNALKNAGIFCSDQ